MRLQQRLSLTILPAILGPLAIIGVIAYLQLQTSARQKALDSMQTATEQLSENIRHDIAAKNASLKFLAIASPLHRLGEARQQVGGGGALGALPQLLLVQPLRRDLVEIETDRGEQQRDQRCDDPSGPAA